MFGFGDILQKVQEMQSKAATIQEELAQKTVEGQSGGGMVRVVCTGKQEIVSVHIEKSVISPEDADMLQDLVVAALNDALRQSKQVAEKEMGALTAGLNLPGGLKIPGLM